MSAVLTLSAGYLGSELLGGVLIVRPPCSLLTPPIAQCTPIINDRLTDDLARPAASSSAVSASLAGSDEGCWARVETALTRSCWLVIVDIICSKVASIIIGEPSLALRLVPGPRHRARS